MSKYNIHGMPISLWTLLDLLQHSINMSLCKNLSSYHAFILDTIDIYTPLTVMASRHYLLVLHFSYLVHIYIYIPLSLLQKDGTCQNTCKTYQPRHTPRPVKLHTKKNLIWFFIKKAFLTHLSFRLQLSRSIDLKSS